MKIAYGFILVFSLVFSLPAHATSLQDYQAKSPEMQGRLVAGFIDKMATDLSAQNPQLGRAIVEYFAVTPAGKELPEGIADLAAQEMTVDSLAKQGKADKSKIQVESMIVYVVKQKFMTTQTAQR